MPYLTCSIWTRMVASTRTSLTFIASSRRPKSSVTKIGTWFKVRMFHHTNVLFLFKRLTSYLILWWLLKGLVEVRKGEMSRESFVRLHEIEAESGDFNPDDMNQRLFNLGFNKSLEIEHVK